MTDQARHDLKQRARRFAKDRVGTAYDLIRDLAAELEREEKAKRIWKVRCQAQEREAQRLMEAVRP